MGGDPVAHVETFGRMDCERRALLGGIVLYGPAQRSDELTHTSLDDVRERAGLLGPEAVAPAFRTPQDHRYLRGARF